MKTTFAIGIFTVIVAGTLSAQTNTFPSSGNVGIGTTAPITQLDIRPFGSTPAWIGLDKNPGMETGIQFRKSGTVQFFLFTDNADGDALKIQSTSVSGENDDYPRLFIPQNNRDLYFGLSGGNVAIGHKTPYSPSRLHVKASSSTFWSIVSEASNNDRIVGLSHDGTNGVISTSFLGTGGFSPLLLQTSNLPRLAIAVDGNVGIGTEAPQAKLHISNGDVLLQNTSSGYPSMYLKDITGNNSLRFDYNSIIHGGGHLYIRSGESNNLLLNDAESGNVGIGTANPNEKLTVNGTIYGKEIKVDLSVPAPDYVFAKNYDLPTLEELQAYISVMNHLPEVPSAREMEEDGINVGEMNMILLKKVEELTLYILQQQSQLQRQGEALDNLRQEIDSLASPE